MTPFTIDKKINDVNSVIPTDDLSRHEHIAESLLELKEEMLDKPDNLLNLMRGKVPEGKVVIDNCTFRYAWSKDIEFENHKGVGHILFINVDDALQPDLTIIIEGDDWYTAKNYSMSDFSDESCFKYILSLLHNVYDAMDEKFYGG